MPIVERHLLDAGGDQKEFRFQFPRQQAGDAILVDDRVDSHQPVALEDHGNASASAGDHQRVIGERALDGGEFHNLLGLR